MSEGFKGGTRGSPLCRETSVSRTANIGTVGMNGLNVSSQAGEGGGEGRGAIVYCNWRVFQEQEWGNLHNV